MGAEYQKHLSGRDTGDETHTTPKQFNPLLEAKPADLLITFNNPDSRFYFMEMCRLTDDVWEMENNYYPLEEYEGLKVKKMVKQMQIMVFNDWAKLHDLGDGDLADAVRKFDLARRKTSERKNNKAV